MSILPPPFHKNEQIDKESFIIFEDIQRQAFVFLLFNLFSKILNDPPLHQPLLH
jgi:hypothetical protein